MRRAALRVIEGGGKRLKRERTGDSPEKLAERHTPADTAVDRMLKLGGVEQESRFKD